jgi:hypothetical protein
MSGIRYFLDTNAIIFLLNGNAALEAQLQKAHWIGTSVVCLIKFLSFQTLSSNDKELLYSLTNRIAVIQLESSFPELEKIAELRKITKLKLPDAIIAASARINEAVLVSNNKHLSSIADLTVQSF